MITTMHNQNHFKFIFTSSVPISHRTQPIFVAKRIRMMLFRGIIGRRSKHVNTLFGQNSECITVIMCGTYSNHWSLLQ